MGILSLNTESRQPMSGNFAQVLGKGRAPSRRISNFHYKNRLFIITPWEHWRGSYNVTDIFFPGVIERFLFYNRKLSS
jgi:hypothetical protein